MLCVLDVLPQRREAIDLGGKCRGDRGLGRLALGGDLGRGAGGIGMDDRLEAVVPYEPTALGESPSIVAPLGASSW
jgi:hypothetical protein